MSNIGTTILTNDSTTINAANGILALSMVLLSGSATFSANLPIGHLTTYPISLVINEPVTIIDNTAIDGLTIDATAGEVKIMVRQ